MEIGRRIYKIEETKQITERPAANFERRPR
jgi:hypothetical protein